MKSEAEQNNWDECICLNCGHTWNASEDEYFNFTFCYNCHSDKIGGEYWREELKIENNNKNEHN